MDILEEIDVFFSACQLTQDESNNLVFNGMTGCFESKYLADWFVNQINFGWKLWQAAKAQAVPEGFVLVPKKATKKMLDAGYEAHDGFFSNGAVQDVYVAMVEAQDLNHGI